MIETNQLSLAQGSAISSVALTEGNAGSIRIKADDFIQMIDSKNELLEQLELSEFINNSRANFSGIIVSAAAVVASTPENLPNQPRGNSGNIMIETPRLFLSDNGIITVGNLGTGSGGSLEINADLIKLDNASFITSATLSGNGGNIFISSQDIQLFRQSGILSTAGGKGNGGNIFINADRGLILLGGSQIAANAFAGNGGNVLIKTQALISDVTSSITATSQLGIDGQVEIQVPETGQPKVSLSEIELISNDEKLIASCLNRPTQVNQFILSGNGGLPQTPDSNLGTFPLLSLEEDDSWSVQRTSKVSPSANALLKTEDGRIIAITIQPETRQIICP